MPSVAYGSSAYTRSTGNFPPLELINMFLEEAKTSENGVALQSRPGLAENATRGSATLTGMFSETGTRSGALFVIANNRLYEDANDRGAITGSGVAKFAGSSTELVVTKGGTAYSWNGTNLASITFPDTANVRSVCYIGNLFVFVRDATQKFYWSSPLDGRTIDSLDFASAERKEDQLLDIAALGDNLWLFGQSTLECWAHTGDSDLPFTRIEQVSFDKGIHSTGALCAADNTLFFVGSNNSVYRLADVPTRISDHSIEERIGASATARLFSFIYQGHEFVVVRLASETLAYDCATGEWCEFQTNSGNWIAAYGAMVGATAYFAHESTNQIMTFSGWLDIAASLERRFSFAQQLNEPTPINSIRIWTNPGQAATPTVELRLSNDAGQSFGSWASIDLGTTADYREMPEWRALGMYDFPGILGEIRTTSNAPFRVSNVQINEKRGGRSR